MRSSVAAAAATCALALVVVCALVTYIPRSSNAIHSDVEALLSVVRVPSAEHEPSAELTTPVLLSTTPPQLTKQAARRKQATRLAGKITSSSLASVGTSVHFNRDDSINFGRMTVQTSVGFTVIAQFAFSAQPGSWERIYDIGPFWGGSGQGMGVVLARQGGSNTLTNHLYAGGGQPGMEIYMGNEIQPNRQMTTVSTYQCIPAGVRFVRIQARRSYLQLGFVSVQTADGTNVALGKRASASGSYPGTDPSKAVNGPATPRHHPHLTAPQNLWHATSNLDWWEVDLGREFAVTKIVVYNRQECCRERMQDALVTTLDSSRNVINTVTLNSNAVQEFSFAPFIGTFRLYMKDGTRNNQLWLASEVRRAGVPCASATFDNTFVAKSNWGHDALFSGQIGYFSFQNGVASYGDLSALAAVIQENPQNAPGNWLRANPVFVPGYTVIADTFVNPQSSLPAVAAPSARYTRPVIFTRTNQNYLDFGRTVSNPNDGISYVVSFAFTGNEPGTWERVFDFGSGPDSGNFILARHGGSNDLIFLGNYGGPTTTQIIARNVISPGRLIVAVCTHAAGTSKFYLNGNLVGQASARPRPGLRSFSQSFLGKSNWPHDAFFNGQIFYFQELNAAMSDAHQRVVFDSLKVAANSVIGYIPASVQAAPTRPIELRDDALPCGNNLLANEGLTNPEGTARLIMQGDGNLVLYNKNGKALWNSGTAGSVNDRLEVQSDGNLVVYQGTHVRWASHSNVRPHGCELVVQDDCNVVLYRSDPSGSYGADNALGNFAPRDALWNSRTSGRCNEPLFN